MKIAIVTRLENFHFRPTDSMWVMNNDFVFKLFIGKNRYRISVPAQSIERASLSSVEKIIAHIVRMELNKRKINGGLRISWKQIDDAYLCARSYYTPGYYGVLRWRLRLMGIFTKLNWYWKIPTKQKEG